jgi:hypothetical protein
VPITTLGPYDSMVTWLEPPRELSVCYQKGTSEVHELLGELLCG